MSLSRLPLSYCTNVHPGTTVADVLQGLERYTAPARQRYEGPLAAGLWLAAPVIRELTASPDATPAFVSRLGELGLPCYTLNAFPYGDFHSPRVKENVYIPDWTKPERLEYTLACANVLASLAPDGVDGSISTVPLGFKQFEHPADFFDRCIDQLLDLAEGLRRIEDATGRRIALAIEPEPLCILETTPEAIGFFQRLWQTAGRRGLEAVARRHLGLCYDVCHQAVEFEDVPASIGQIAAAGLRIEKVHVSCAIHLDDPRDEESRRELARYVEPRYLHQTFARTADGRTLRTLDLTEAILNDPPAELLAADAWRVHFHVPVNAESLGPLGTTRGELKQALAAVAALDYAPHLEVETYTWRVMPGQSVDLADVLAQELSATRQLVQSLGNA